MKKLTHINLIQVKKIVNRVFNSNTYILRSGNSQDVWLVDCGDIDRIIETLLDDEMVITVIATGLGDEKNDNDLASFFGAAADEDETYGDVMSFFKKD